MTKINMTKYGFIRWPEEDFTDDGSRFTCYRVGERVRVSKTTYQGEVFISARIDGRKLPYEVYSSLEHYKALDKLNGVRITSLTDQDLNELYDVCIAYEKEYNEAESSIAMPSLEEIKECATRLQERQLREVEEATSLVGKHIILLASKLTDYGWKELRGHLVSLKSKAENFDIDRYTEGIYDTRMSIDFCKPDSSYMKDSYDYTAIIKTVRSFL
jgi:hypothetical protein